MWSLPSCLEADSIPPESTSRSVTKLTNHRSRASRALHQRQIPSQTHTAGTRPNHNSSVRSLLISNLAEAPRKGGRNCEVLKMASLISEPQHHLPGYTPLYCRQQDHTLCTHLLSSSLASGQLHLFFFSFFFFCWCGVLFFFFCCVTHCCANSEPAEPLPNTHITFSKKA